MVGIEREIIETAISRQQGINLTGSNHIILQLPRADNVNAVTGAGQRFIIRFAINTINQNYTIVNSADNLGTLIRVDNTNRLFINSAPSDKFVVLNEYIEVVCGGQGTSPTTYIRPNGFVSSGNFGNKVPYKIENCYLFEIATGYLNDANFCNSTSRSRLAYNAGKGSELSKLKFFNGLNHLNQTGITSPATNHVKFEEQYYNSGTKKFTRLRVDLPLSGSSLTGFDTNYISSGQPIFVQRIGTQIII